MRYRQVLRRLAHSPGFTAIAVLTLALGIGATSAVFSVLDGVLLKPLPYPHPEELISVGHSTKDMAELGIAAFVYLTYREQNRSLRDIGMWYPESSNVTGLAAPEHVDVLLVTDAILPLLGISPELGRWFSGRDDSPGTPETAIVMYGYWQSRFGGDRSVIGRGLMVDGRPREIIGVMPARFHFLDYHPALILPFRLHRSRAVLGGFGFRALTRLRPGVSLSQANADAARMVPIGLDSFPPFPGYTKKMFEDSHLTPHLRPLKQDVIGSLAGTLWLVMGTIGMVLLIACANVANLLLVRADARRRELAIRSALGAGRRTIAGDLLAESLTLGALGGLAGLLLAYGALRLLVRIAPASLPRLGEIGIDVWVLLFTLGVSLGAGLLFGAIPVWKFAGPRVAAALHGGGRTSSESRETHRSRNVLVVVQVALALVLLVSAGLMIRSFQALRHVQPGFTHPEWVETMQISIPESQVKDATAVVRMEQDILEKVAAIPGVESAGLASAIPLNGSIWRDTILFEDRDYPEGQLPPWHCYRLISPGGRDATGTRLVAGRDFTWADVYARRPISMVSENLAREIWRTPQAAIGKHVRAMPQDAPYEIVGVVEDVRYDGLDKNFSTTVYWPILLEHYENQPVFVWRSMFYMIRSRRTGGEGFLNELQHAVWSVNPNLPLADVQPLRRIYDTSLARTSFTLVMLSLAGGMALLLGMIGIYGVISYSVAQRTREIGIRMALGAQRGELTRLFLRDGLRLSLAGVACGLAAAAILMRLMAELLFEVRPVDPVTYVAVSTCLVAAALAASYLPTLRITRIDPVNALRAE